MELDFGMSPFTLQLLRILRPWDTKTNAEQARLEGHSRWVCAFVLPPNGQLALGSDDKTIRLWDLKIGAELTRLEVDAEVRCLAALSDGRLVAGDQLGLARNPRVTAVDASLSAVCDALMATARVSGASLGSGRANKIDVRYTSNCAIWFRNLQHQRTASCAKVKIPAVAKLCGLGPGRKSAPSGAAEMPKVRPRYSPPQPEA